MPKLTVFELRNYEMRPGGRDRLISMFERHFLESQEALGVIVVGIFRNLDDPNRFVWMRGFESMATRFAALDGFYTSAIWREHRDAANAAMIDSDNVLLLRPVSGVAVTQPTVLPQPNQIDAIILVRTYALSRAGVEAFAATYQSQTLPRLSELGAEPFATFATEHAENSYPRLPIRDGETVFVSLTRFASAEAFDANRAALAEIDAQTLTAHAAAPELMRLSPTPRSRLR
jgi:hypothetical protein